MSVGRLGRPWDGVSNIAGLPGTWDSASVRDDSLGVTGRPGMSRHRAVAEARFPDVRPYIEERPGYIGVAAPPWNVDAEFLMGINISKAKLVGVVMLKPQTCLCSTAKGLFGFCDVLRILRIEPIAGIQKCSRDFSLRRI